MMTIFMNRPILNHCHIPALRTRIFLSVFIFLDLSIAHDTVDNYAFYETFSSRVVYYHSLHFRITSMSDSSLFYKPPFFFLSLICQYFSVLPFPILFYPFHGPLSMGIFIHLQTSTTLLPLC